MDILTGENIPSILVATMVLIYWSARSSINSRADEVKWMDVGYRYFSQLWVSLYQSTLKPGATSK